MKKKFISMIVAIFAITSISVAQNTVFDIIEGSADHDTLEAAIIAAGLDGTLSGPGPFTVFAPTDAAFAALPDGTIDALLADPGGALTDILLYHVVGDSVESGDLTNGQYATTLFGDSVIVTVNGGVYINDAMVTGADIRGDNGVVHVIDVVITPDNSVMDIIGASGDHNTLEAGIVAATLQKVLTGPGEFTVFAPTDAAFALLPAGVLDALLADPSGDLTDILLYHVIGDSVGSGDLSNGMYAATVNGDSVIVTISGADVYINDAMVLAANIDADNGVVHVIDAVIMPGTSVMDIVGGSADHNTLEAGIVAATLQSTLTSPGPFTLFAPTDAAFAALPEGTLDALLADPSGDLTDILLYHVVGAKAMAADLSNGQLITTLNGDSVTVMIMNDTVYIDGAMVTVADLEATNGVVHVIDAVLMPRTTVVDIIVGSADHNTLEAAVIAADLAGTLSGDGPFTVFAPTDAAFAALPEGTLDALLADPSGDLTDILLYHVVGSEAFSGDLTNGMMITTLNGDSVTVTIMNDTVYINDAMVTAADIATDNGVIHVIDAVLIPTTPTTTVVDIIVGSEDHNTLEAAVIAADLAGTLSGDGPFTVFAPTDAAFAALPEGTLDALLADPSGDLTDILLYHVVGAKAMAADLSNGQLITTLNGESVEVSIDGSIVMINGAMVTFADLEATNGVVHVIDAVLLPPTAVEEKSGFENFSLYPNPASDVVNLQFSLENDGTVNIEVYNLLGSQVMNTDLGYYPAGSVNTRLDVSYLQRGIYMVSVESGSYRTVTKIQVVK